jgi:hypothetical protein
MCKVILIDFEAKKNHFGDEVTSTFAKYYIQQSNEESASNTLKF